MIRAAWPKAGRAYLIGTTGVGLAMVIHALLTMALSPVPIEWFILAGLTLLSGSFTVRIPTTTARLSVSEIFVFAAVLLFGAAAATIIVLLDVLVVSLWRARLYAGERLERVLFNAAAASAAIWTASHTYYLMTGLAPWSVEEKPILELVPGLIVLATVYFLLNSFLIAWAIGFEQNTSPFVIWRRNFLWLSLNYFSGASIAVLLLPYLYPADQFAFASILGVLLPIMLISYLTFRTALGRVDDTNRHLTELNKLYLSTIETLAMAIDAKDQITHGHIRRVQLYAVGLARKMGVTDDSLIRAIEAAALLHDMGKLAVPEYILNKPGPLTPAEFDKMKLHASVGADILSAIDFPYPVVPIVRHHHECWDGTGYPDGLKGPDIPIGARILSVVDCFDALTSDRPYRPRLSDKEAIRILRERRGTMYDPLVVDTFIEVHSELAVSGPSAGHHSLAAISSVATVPRTSPFLQTQPLDDIAASSDEMLTLFRLSRELTGRMSVADVGDVLLKHLRRLVPSSLCVFYSYDEDTTDLAASHVFGEHGEAIKGVRIPLGERLSGWVGANRQTIRNSDPILDFGDIARAMKPRLHSCLSTPLLSAERLVGVLSLYAPDLDAFTEEHERLLEIVARQVAPVLQRSVDYTSSSLRTFRDPLTGLPNLEHLRQLLGDHTNTVELPLPSSVVYVDVIDLKRINQAHGRGTGDQVLKDLVQQLRSTLRAADVLFKLEGDELAVLLLQTDNETAETIASRIRTSGERIAVAQSTPVNVTVAVATAPGDGNSIEALIRSARGRVSEALSRPQHGHQPPRSIH